MASKIKVDNIENQCGGAVVTKCGATTTISGSVVKANDIQAADGGNLINQCGTTITLGASGDTINLAAGATQSGFGRTGTVDWDTTAKTASFTAVSGNGYFVNTTSGAITLTLPATPSAGDIVSISDYAGTAATNNITIGRNGSNIEGIAENAAINSNREARTYVYVDGTQGWIPVNTNDSPSIPPAYVTATGGTVTCCGDYKIHTFTGPGTFCVSCAGNSAGSNTVDYLVVAGGGGGGYSNGAGGGAGGYRESHCSATSGCYTASPLATPTSLPVTATGYPITVGGGGAGGNSGNAGCSGSNSVFSTITSAGGGGAGGASTPGCSGGSGAGGGNGGVTGGAGNTPPVSPPQGNNGGSTSLPAAPSYAAAGGGGAGSVGSDTFGSLNGGPGGNGVTSSINASPVTRAGGGGGAADPGFTGGSGGPGCGGKGGDTSGGNGSAGGTNKGSGGGGGTSHGSGTVGGTGGSGIVIIRYKFQ